MDRTSPWALFEKAKMAGGVASGVATSVDCLFMGGATGAAVGFLVGSFTVLRYGPGERGFLGTIGTQMLQTGGFLGFIFSIGMLLRADDEKHEFRPFPFMQRSIMAAPMIRQPRITVEFTK
ncbi:subunit of TIM23 translocase complex [Phlyctochytrium bullatum]|nr:subunit of TIM23 translocase complex [Phlyctochytrium bullatum]